jgi:hypothetical protein
VRLVADDPKAADNSLACAGYQKLPVPAWIHSSCSAFMEILKARED